ncbi:hypothetical protein B0H14DRAFT_3543470 [Mycena olivaceomarginata]|nr:hypothetical protein B0H14DRAFT_3543470 [Mycena olivaceomarginata]
MSTIRKAESIALMGFLLNRLDVPVAGPSAAALAISGEEDEMRKEDETNGTLTQGIYRFTDEADQQRVLIEMHGLYCISRPMRISPATANFKPPQAGGVSPAGLSTSASSPGMPTSVSVSDQQQQQQQSVSAPIAVPSTASYYPSGGDAVAYAPGGGVMSTSATGGGTGAEYFAPPPYLGTFT